MARVLLTGFCAVPGPRRAGVQLRHVIRSLTALHTVDVLVVREGDQGYVERQGSVRVLRVPTHESDLRAQIQSFQRALKRQLDGADYDVVHCRDAWCGIPVLDTRSRFGYAVVYDLTRSPLGESTLDSELDAQYGRDEEACILASDLVLAPTVASVKALQGRGRPERVVLAPPGVDVDRFDWDQPSTDSIPRILYCGSLDPGRGVRVLVRAMAAIVREIDARLVLAGPVVSPKFEQSVRDTLRELGIADKVEIIGAVDHDQLPALIATASVCVVPAASDLTPNPAVVYPTKMLEYMACRRAVVAPKREIVSTVAENGREALLFEPGDPIDLARKVLRLIGEPTLRDQIAQAGYERVRRDFTASAARRYVRHAYQLLAERFADQFSPPPGPADDAPKVEMLADDDFEATVFEEAPQAPNVDTALNHIDDPEQIEQIATSGDASSGSIAVPPVPPDETQERVPVAPPPPAASDPRTSPPRDWSVTGLAAAVQSLVDEAEAEGDVIAESPVAAAVADAELTASNPAVETVEPDGLAVVAPDDAAAGSDDVSARDVAIAGREVDAIDTDGQGLDAASADADEDGTPIEGVRVPPGPLVSSETPFVAGEIDVPTPPPQPAASEQDSSGGSGAPLARRSS
jgi:glycosyltransferase involved in cell wall biosynthesis